MLRVVYGFINLCHSCDWGDLVCLYTTMRDGWVKGQEVNCWVYWSSASWSCPSASSWWSNYKQLSRGSKRRLGQAIDHGMELLVSHLFCILICPLLYICSACLHYHFSLIRGREGISLSISIIKHIKGQYFRCVTWHILTRKEGSSKLIMVRELTPVNS